jgi:predicted esterase
MKTPHARESHVEVGRTARYWSIGEIGAATEVWFVLHGYKQLARRFLRRFEHIAEPHRLIVAPEALSRFYASPEPGRHGPDSIVGASWMTREDRMAEIADQVSYLDRLAAVIGVGRTPVTVLGFSQGTAVAARWITIGKMRPERLILWAGYLPHDLDVARASQVFTQTRLVLARGAQDPGVDDDLAAAERAMLTTGGIAAEVVEYAGGHDIDPEVLRRMADGDVGPS